MCLTITITHHHVPFLMNWTFYAILPLMCCDLFLPYFWNEFINDLELFHFLVQHIFLEFVCTLFTLLHYHCLFHLAVQSASHNIQTTFVGPSFCCLLVTFLIYNQQCLWTESLFFFNTLHFFIKFLCFIVIINNFHWLQLWFKQSPPLSLSLCLNILCASFLLSLWSCSLCLVFLSIILLKALFSPFNIIRHSTSNQLFLLGLLISQCFNYFFLLFCSIFHLYLPRLLIEYFVDLLLSPWRSLLSLLCL